MNKSSILRNVFSSSGWGYTQNFPLVSYVPSYFSSFGYILAAGWSYVLKAAVSDIYGSNSGEFFFNITVPITQMGDTSLLLEPLVESNIFGDMTGTVQAVQAIALIASTLQQMGGTDMPLCWPADLTARALSTVAETISNWPPQFPTRLLEAASASAAAAAAIPMPDILRCSCFGPVEQSLLAIVMALVDSSVNVSDDGVRIISLATQGGGLTAYDYLLAVGRSIDILSTRQYIAGANVTSQCIIPPNGNGIQNNVTYNVSVVNDDNVTSRASNGTAMNGSLNGSSSKKSNSLAYNMTFFNEFLSVLGKVTDLLIEYTVEVTVNDLENSLTDGLPWQWPFQVNPDDNSGISAWSMFVRAIRNGSAAFCSFITNNSSFEFNSSNISNGSNTSDINTTVPLFCENLSDVLSQAAAVAALDAYAIMFGQTNATAYKIQANTSVLRTSTTSKTNWTSRYRVSATSVVGKSQAMAAGLRNISRLPLLTTTSAPFVQQSPPSTPATWPDGLIAVWTEQSLAIPSVVATAADLISPKALRRVFLARLPKEGTQLNFSDTCATGEALIPGTWIYVWPDNSTAAEVSTFSITTSSSGTEDFEFILESAGQCVMWDNTSWVVCDNESMALSNMTHNISDGIAGKPSSVVCNSSSICTVLCYCPAAVRNGSFVAVQYNQCTPICGNGQLNEGEQCDDGGLSSGDGCSSSCTIEPGWTCAVAQNTSTVCVGIEGPSVCVLAVLEEFFVIESTNLPAAINRIHVMFAVCFGSILEQDTGVMFIPSSSFTAATGTDLLELGLCNHYHK